MKLIFIILIVIAFYKLFYTKLENYINIKNIDVNYINLRKSKNRKLNLINQEKTFKNIKLNRYPAIHGDKIDSNVLNIIKTNLQKNNKRILKTGEIGCYISHCNLWNDLFESKDIMLIVEDDVTFVDNFEDKLTNCINELPNDWELLLIGFRFHNPEKNLDFSENLQETKSTFFG